jgi:hypothetical protein
MRIIENTPDRLVLRGVPGGAGGMAFVLALSVVFIVSFSGMSFWLATTGRAFGAAMMAIGVIVGLIAAYAGLDAMLTRESVVIDHAAGTGVYEKRRVVRRTPMDRREFARNDIAAVVLERRVVRSPRTDMDNRLDRESIQWTALLRIDNPRRRIDLFQSQNDREVPVRAVAVAVAQSLGLPLTEDLGEDGSLGEEVDTAEFTTPLAKRTDGPIVLPPQPAGSRIAVEIDPDGSVVRFRWRVMGNNVLPNIGVVIFGGWTAVSTLFLLAALGVVGGQAPASPAIIGATASFVVFGFALMTPMVLLLAGAKRTVTITPEWVSARSALLLGNSRCSRPAVKTVRIAPGDDDAAIVYHGDTKMRIGLHLPVEGEVQWLAGAMRSAIRAMG